MKFDISKIDIGFKGLQYVYWFVFILRSYVQFNFGPFIYILVLFVIFLAKDVERCHAGDTDCIVRVANIFIEFFGQSEYFGYIKNEKQNIFVANRHFFKKKFCLFEKEGIRVLIWFRSIHFTFQISESSKEPRVQ